MRREQIRRTVRNRSTRRITETERGNMNTPWGKSDHQEKYADGITFYSTPSHGGFKLNSERNEQIPSYCREPDGWYEEDCAWAIVALVFAGVFLVKAIHEGHDPNKDIELARDTFRNWNPNEYEMYYGIKLEQGESYRGDNPIT